MNLNNIENSLVIYTDAEFDAFWGDEDSEFLDLNCVDNYDYDDTFEEDE